jgi:CSLREA domain-containing protein
MRRNGGKRSGLLAALALLAVIAALGGSGSAEAGFFTGNTSGIASITGDGQSAVLLNGTYYLFVPSNYGSSTVPVTVTAASGSNYVSILGTVLSLSSDTASVNLEGGYVVSVCKPGNAGTGDPSNCDHFNFDPLAINNFDTNLRALSMSPGGVSFPWTLGASINSQLATSYSARVPANTPSVTISANAEDPLATVEIDGHAGTSRSVSIAAHGLTDIPVTVVAADGTDSQTYTIAVTAGSSDATLSNLTISPGTIANFSPATTTYNVTVPSSTTQVNITPTLDDPNASWYIDLKPDNTNVQQETDSLPHPITLNATDADPTILYVGVEAEDQTTYGDYFIYITHLVSEPLGVHFSGTGNGVVTSTSPDNVVDCASPGAGTCTTHYDDTTSVTLSEAPAVGSYFVGWSSDCSGTGATSTFTMPSHATTCTADFASLGAKQTSPFKVTTAQDLSDGSCYANRCSLRDALAAAAAGTGGTITFAGGVGEIDLGSALSYTGKPLTVTGNVTLDGTGITTGDPILSLAGTVTLNGITFADATDGGLVLQSGTLRMTGGGFENNTNPECGGFAITGTATMTNVLVDGNGDSDFPYPGKGGGGCVAEGSSLTVTGSTFAENAAFFGSGIDDGGKLTVLDTDFADNGWPFEFLGEPGLGAGVVVESTGTATVTNSVFTDNGGADALDAEGPTKLVSSTIAGNEYGIWGPISLLDSIVDDNGSGDGTSDCFGGSTSLGHNVLGTGCSFAVSSDKVTNDAGLGAETDGVLPLLNGSPALDAGVAGTVSGVTVPTTDALGAKRPQGGAVDIGAVEMLEHKLTIKTAGGGTGTVAPDAAATPAAGVASPGGWYVAGSTVQLTANPTGGSAFAGWSGACTGASNPVDVLISADQTCTATFAPKPVVTSFAPSSGRVGTAVTIKGSKFTGVTGVAFGDMPAASFKVVSDTTITAVVPIDAATGVITVSDASLSTDSAGTFTYTWTKPSIASFTPATGKANAPVTLTGSDFLGTTVVAFGGMPGTSLDVVSDTKITVDVPANGTGPITATNPGGTGQSKANFTFLSAPTITSFSPEDAAFGATVTITGSHFTGTTAVGVSGVPVKFVVVNDSTITFAVPTNAAAGSGQIDVTNAGGQTESADNFTLDWATPTITSFTPTSARIRAIVTITGTGFTRASEVDFGSHAAPTFTVVSDTKITAVVPDTVGTSPVAITVKRPGGTPGTSGGNFTPAFPKPTITSFTPASAAAGATVTVTGTGFLDETAVAFNGVAGTVTGTGTDTKLTVTVPNTTSATGKISVTGPGGTGTSAGTLTFLSPPTVTSFSPEDAAFGATITITGSHFTGTKSVKIGGVAATFKLIGDTSMTATVPVGASNTPAPISVTNAIGTTPSSDNFTLDWATPTITSFTPTTGRIGTKITLTGTHFTRASGVMIGSTPATNVTVVSDTSITAVVPTNVAAGAQHITASNPGATSAASTGTFTPTFPKPTITSFTPTSGIAGVTITITGTGFLGATEVDVGGAAALSFTVVSDTKITVVVPTLAASGTISVTTPGGTGTSSGSLTISA